jgi:HSP20 family molecular chaperone IbpA
MNATTRQDLTTSPADDREMPAVIPPVDVVEDAQGITLRADVPGVTKDTLSIRVDGDTLILDATLKLGEPAQMEPVHVEMRSPRYRRSFTLSRELDSAHIEASLKDGVLTLRVPKLEHARPRRIEVRAA